MAHLDGEETLAGDAEVEAAQVGGRGHKIHGQGIVLVEGGCAQVLGPCGEILLDALQEHLPRHKGAVSNARRLGKGRQGEILLDALQEHLPRHV